MQNITSAKTLRFLQLSIGVACALALAGCDDTLEQVPQPVIEPEPAVTGEALQPTTVTRLPVSLNAVMVALVNQAADPIWVAAWRSPESEADWRELERRAVQLELSGALLSVPGTGPLDDKWTRNPQWQQWAIQLQRTGSDAVAAVKARDLQAISSVGDAIVAICEGCHMDFKLALPTGGEFGELSPTGDDFAEYRD
jgi:hypothetical protein